MGDNGLLQEFAASRSESAFAALVRQHMNLVFATACRQLGNHSLAEEVTQSVFVALARKAGSVGRHPTLAGWLHRATLLECRRVLRTELRRQRCEQVAVAVGTVSAAGESVWASLVPLLDEALLQLHEKDRLAVLLRFLEEKPLREVGQVLGASENAAQKRVARALSQMTVFFRQRGFAVPALTGSAPLFAAALQAAPAGLAGSVTSSVLAASSLANATTSNTLSLLSLMNISAKIRTTAVIVLILAGIAVPVWLISRYRSRTPEPMQVPMARQTARGLNAGSSSPLLVQATTALDKASSGTWWVTMPVTTELQRLKAGPAARACVVVNYDAFPQDKNNIDAKAADFDELRI